MDMLYYILGVIAAAAILAGALAVTLLIYFRLCANHPARKLKIEIGLVIFVALLSLAVRIVICIIAAPKDSLSGGVDDLFKNIFYTIAAFTFNGDFAELESGLLASFYYGVIIYASLVFLTAVTSGVSYEIYSELLLWGARNLPGKNTYYVFTSITPDSLVLANSIKRNHKDNNSGRCTVIFFEKGEESFSRKDPLHRALMESGFLFLSDSRRDDNGNVICLLKKLKLHSCLLKKHNSLFHVFAMDYGEDYEGDNAETVFDDLKATVNAYIKNKNGNIVSELPVAVNYHLLTGGEINFESYDRQKSAVLDECECFKGGVSKDIKRDIGLMLPVHVFNEATLSSYDLVYERKNLLDKLGDTAFDREGAPDADGAYRIAVIGFGKTGQYAMEELYIHSAHLIETGAGYEPVQFIADVYDAKIDEKSGLFAYNHPLFRCVNDDDFKDGSDTKRIKEVAQNVSGKAFEILYTECEQKTGRGKEEAKKFVDSKMGFPIVYMHKEQCFKYPFIDEKSAETAIETAKKNNVRAFVVALGNDESNIAMANVLIDSFRRSLLKDFLAGKKTADWHITIYVNLIEARSRHLLNWNWNEDVKKYSRGYEPDGKSAPQLSVIPFGCREAMYSYENLVEDYNERLYNYGYNFLSRIIEKAEGAEADYKVFLDAINKDPYFYRTNEESMEKWIEVPQFLRLSNKSAHAFAINYYKYQKILGAELKPDDERWIFLERWEHERWDRFFIAHGWIYSPYNKFDNFEGMSKDEKKRVKDREKEARRGVRQHNCLCPFDEMLDDYTKLYDRGNVELGFVDRIVYSK